MGDYVQCVHILGIFEPVRFIHGFKEFLFFISPNMLNKKESEIGLANRKHFFMPWFSKALYYRFWHMVIPCS